MKPDTKTCTKCNQEKPLEQFGLDNRRGSPKAVCRPCDSKIHQELYKRKPPSATQKQNKASINSERYEHNKKKGYCHDCGTPTYGRIYCDEHRKIRAGRESAKRLLGRGLQPRLCPSCSEPLGYRERLCSGCSSPKGERFRAYQNAWLRKQRLETFEKYGGARCLCCGETEPLFLTIDHIKDNGSKHRREISKDGTGAGVSMYRWLKSNNYPPGFRVLCYNCNAGRYRNGGECPHQAQSVSST